MATATVVIIGDEILRAKFRDENSPWLAGRCREIGLDLQRISTISDDVTAIADEVGRAAATSDWVFTSGGVGPTHDDITMAGIAAAFGLALVRHPVLEAIVTERLGDGVNEDALRMADVPEGAELWGDGELRFPLVVVRNVCVFPGVPILLRRKFDSVAHRFAGDPVHCRRVVTTESETTIAGALRALQARWPHVDVGSYPQFHQEPWTVTVTLDSRDLVDLERCHGELRHLLAHALVEDPLA